MRAFLALALGFTFAVSIPAYAQMGYGGPPVAASSSAQNIYWFNPDSGVYYDPMTGLYYWFEDGQWVSDTVPPAGVTSNWVMFGSTASVPYVTNNQLSNYYYSGGYFPDYCPDLLVVGVNSFPNIIPNFFDINPVFDRHDCDNFKNHHDRFDNDFRGRNGHDFDPRHGGDHSGNGGDQSGGDRSGRNDGGQNSGDSRWKAMPYGKGGTADSSGLIANRRGNAGNPAVAGGRGNGQISARRDGLGANPVIGGRVDRQTGIGSPAIGGANPTIADRGGQIGSRRGIAPVTNPAAPGGQLDSRQGGGIPSVGNNPIAGPGRNPRMGVTPPFAIRQNGGVATGARGVRPSFGGVGNNLGPQRIASVNPGFRGGSGTRSFTTPSAGRMRSGIPSIGGGRSFRGGSGGGAAIRSGGGGFRGGGGGAAIRSGGGGGFRGGGTASIRSGGGGSMRGGGAAIPSGGGGGGRRSR